MRKGNTVNYFGRKGPKSLNMTFALMPDSVISTLVDGCFGSGAVTGGLFSLYKGVKKVGIDKNRSVITMHRMMRDRDLEVLDAIEKLTYSRECYEACMEVLERYDRGSGADEISVAAAKYAVLYMSRNSIEGSYRDIEKYKNAPDRRKQRIYWNQKSGLQKKALNVVLNARFTLEDVELINGDFLNYTAFWEDAETFVYLDVPYPMEGRGIYDKRKKDTGYATDWKGDEHEIFLNRVAEMHDSGQLKGKLMICSNFPLDEDGSLMGLQESRYNKMLLSRGFRLVVTEIKHACEASKALGGKKCRKAEVVWVNYTDIAGMWEQYQYYDYADIFPC